MKISITVTELRDALRRFDGEDIVVFADNYDVCHALTTTSVAKKRIELIPEENRLSTPIAYIIDDDAETDRETENVVVIGVTPRADTIYNNERDLARALKTSNDEARDGDESDGGGDRGWIRNIWNPIRNAFQRSTR